MYGYRLGFKKPSSGGGGAVAPVFTVAPAITGTAVVDQTLTCDGGTVTGTEPITRSYQWYRGASAISGATSNTYTLVQADAGNTSNIKCVVGGTNVAGSASADSNTVAQVLDADANAYFTAIALTNSTIKAAENTFFISRKNLFALNTSIASYHLITDSVTNSDRLNQFKFNAYNPINADANKRLVFGGTVTANTTGLQGSANGFANTFVNPSTDYSGTDFTCIYAINTSSSNGVDFGNVDSGGNGLWIATKFTDANTYYGAYTGSQNKGNVIANSKAIYSYKRSGNTVTLKRNNVTVFTDTIAAVSKLNYSMYLLCRNFNGTGQLYTTKEYSFFEFIGSAITAQQETDFYTALAAREAALGR
jgi:hypothetical protein